MEYDSFVASSGKALHQVLTRALVITSVLTHWCKPAVTNVACWTNFA